MACFAVHAQGGGAVRSDLHPCCLPNRHCASELIVCHRPNPALLGPGAVACISSNKATALFSARTTQVRIALTAVCSGHPDTGLRLLWAPILRRRYRGQEAAGDATLWSFIHRSDYEQERDRR